MRARIEPTSNAVQTVDHWASGISSQVDVAVGPDGALYYVGVGTSNVFRASFNVTEQGLVVSNLNLRIDEGGEVVTMVSLASMPAADVMVSVARSAGDPDVAVLAGAELTFTSTNWARPQAVRLMALSDPDSVDDTATVTVSSAGLTSIPIAVSVLDLGGAGQDEIFADQFE
jgi:hypothetical protein